MLCYPYLPGGQPLPSMPSDAINWRPDPHRPVFRKRGSSKPCRSYCCTASRHPPKPASCIIGEELHLIPTLERSDIELIVVVVHRYHHLYRLQDIGINDSILTKD
jgi:hypothetical protein